jgi:hypothetical protein
VFLLKILLEIVAELVKNLQTFQKISDNYSLIMDHIVESLLHSASLHQFPIKPNLILSLPINLDPQCSLLFSKFWTVLIFLISVVCDAYPACLVRLYLMMIITFDSIKFFIINVLAQQPQGQLQRHHNLFSKKK